MPVWEIRCDQLQCSGVSWCLPWVFAHSFPRKMSGLQWLHKGCWAGGAAQSLHLDPWLGNSAKTLPTGWPHFKPAGTRVKCSVNILESEGDTFGAKSCLPISLHVPGLNQGVNIDRSRKWEEMQLNYLENRPLLWWIMQLSTTIFRKYLQRISGVAFLQL